MQSIVIIAEKRILSQNANVYSNELDFSSEAVTNGILESFRDRGIPTYYYSSPKEFLDHIQKHKYDIIFSAIWGGHHSRNKRALIAAICEAYDLCYIGADAYAQALCQDKYLSKSYLKDYALSIPNGMIIKSEQELHKLTKIVEYPCIVKPNDEGSSVGISDNSIARNCREASSLAEELLHHYSPILIEQFVPGKEISICCAGNNPCLTILEAVQLIIDGEQEIERPWGFESKKAGQAIVTREIVTNTFPKEIIEECRRLFLSLGKVDLMRIDGKLHNNQFYVIELSPDCSLHKSCFMSTAFAHNNYSYGDMLIRLSENAWEQYRKFHN